MRLKKLRGKKRLFNRIAQSTIDDKHKMDNCDVREKDLYDYHNVYPVLEERQKAWLDQYVNLKSDYLL